ncbi:MAG: hypothetical protein HC810_02200 [Acaryochloridaceae cyanobacterium RL_2_7]|nr:hypothetical protein [Acaryochloridaceae cyanobacterium RL_2_7]
MPLGHLLGAIATRPLVKKCRNFSNRKAEVTINSSFSRQIKKTINNLNLFLSVLTLAPEYYYVHLTVWAKVLPLIAMDTQLFDLPKNSGILSQKFFASDLPKTRLFTSSASAIGDFNGDGFDDWQFSGSGYDRKTNRSFAETYLIFGSDTRDRSPKDLSNIPNDQGFRLSQFNDDDPTIKALGDVNGDGFDDLVINFHVVFGSAEPDPNLNLGELNGTNGFAIVPDYSYYGEVLPVGDFNGDGFDDMLISTYRYEPFSRGNIQAYLIFGRESGFDASVDLLNLAPDQGLTFETTPRAYHRGEALGIGDINGDGFDDIVFSSTNVELTRYNLVPFTDQLIIYGNDETSATPIDPEFAADLRIRRRGDFRNIGDINGDGQSDFIDFNRIYLSPEDLSNLPSRLDGVNGFRIQSNRGDRLRISTAGDINQDGIDDLLVNNLNLSFRGLSTRKGLEFQDAYIIFGQAEGFKKLIRLERLNPSQGFAINFGADSLTGSLQSIGDVNGDGITDAVSVFSSNSAEVIYGQAAPSP